MRKLQAITFALLLTAASWGGSPFDIIRQPAGTVPMRTDHLELIHVRHPGWLQPPIASVGGRYIQDQMGRWRVNVMKHHTLSGAYWVRP